MKFRHTASFALLLGSLGLSVLAGPALADARQDVFSVAQRCGGIADGRTWLECYYGAAQPMRAQLGLPAASAAQIRLAQDAPPGQALADARQDVLSATQRCAAIADDRTWLDCYYGAAQPMRAQLGLPAAPASQVRLVPQLGFAAPTYIPQPTYGVPAYGAAPVLAAPAYGIAAPPSYGVQAPPAYGVPARPTNNGPQVVAASPAPPPLKRNRNQGFFTSIFGGGKPIVANMRMRSFAKDKNGRFSVILADGEIWEMDEADDNNQPNWRGAASRYVVNIYEGALSSYNMEVSDDSHLYKVHRTN